VEFKLRIPLVEFLDANVDFRLDDTNENYRWIGLDPAVAEANGEDRYVLQALLRLQAWNPSYCSKSRILETWMTYLEGSHIFEKSFRSKFTVINASSP
jgi:hypothetical protein